HRDEPFDPQDIRNMGGLRHRMPITYWTYLNGMLALAGVIPFAGFWWKDEILVDSLKLGTEQGRLDGNFGFVLLLVAAGFTAFYMTRQVALVFWGEPRTEAAAHASESGPTMTIPLIVLAVLSLVGAFMNIPDGFPMFRSLFCVHDLTTCLEHSVLYAHAGAF